MKPAASRPAFPCLGAALLLAVTATVCSVSFGAHLPTVFLVALGLIGAPRPARRRNRSARTLAAPPAGSGSVSLPLPALPPHGLASRARAGHFLCWHRPAARHQLRRMKILSADFETSAANLRGCPNWNLPEFAFIGRSNVGKSSLINLLTGRKGLAMAAATPGKTKLLNFFRVNQNWSLVDLPGYGFAKVATQDKHEFNTAVAEYIEKRPNLATLFLLIDSRLEPQRIDLDFLAWLSRQNVDVAFVFTKADKQSAAKTQAAIDTFLEAAIEFLSDPAPPVFACSATAKTGREEILAHLARRLIEARA
jgi:GTP-binding protein